MKLRVYESPVSVKANLRLIRVVTHHVCDSHAWRAPTKTEVSHG